MIGGRGRGRIAMETKTDGAHTGGLHLPCLVRI